MNTKDLVDILTASIAPFLLISGTGLLLLSMTNRLARPLDLIRRLLGEAATAQGRTRRMLSEQIRILHHRCRLMRTAIALAVASILCISVMVLVLFYSFLFDLSSPFLVESLFTASLICLFSSLLFFLWDIRIMLNTLKIEIDRHLGA